MCLLTSNDGLSAFSVALISIAVVPLNSSSLSFNCAANSFSLYSISFNFSWPSLSRSFSWNSSYFNSSFSSPVIVPVSPVSLLFDKSSSSYKYSTIDSFKRSGYSYGPVPIEVRLFARHMITWQYRLHRVINWDYTWKWEKCTRNWTWSIRRFRNRQ